MSQTDMDIQAPRGTLQQLVATLPADSGIAVVSEISDVKSTTLRLGLDVLAQVATVVSAVTGVGTLALAVYQAVKKDTDSQIVIISGKGPVTIKWHEKLTLDEIKEMIHRLVL